MLTITRKDLLLTINDNVIPAMGSSDVPVKFVNDTETYAGFLIEPRVGYYVNGCPKSGICEYDTSSNIIKIPAEAFKNKGILVIAIALIDNEDSNHIEVTKELALEVTPAPNGTVILPATDTWQTAVSNLVEQLYNQDYKPQFDEIEEDLHNLVKEAQNQQNKANNQQTQIDNAIDIMGDYEIVQDNPTQIRFKKGNGTYGDTVNLGDNLASKSMVNAGYDTYSGNSYSGSASDYGIEVAQIIGAYEQDGTPTPDAPIEPQFVEINSLNTNGGNLFDASLFPTKTQNGATVTNNGDGSLTFSGNGELTGEFGIYPERFTHDKTIKLLKEGYLKFKKLDCYPLFFIKLYRNDETILDYNSSQRDLNFEITREMLNDETFCMALSIYGSQGGTIKSGTFKPVLYQDGDGTWYPYNVSNLPLNKTYRALPNGVYDYHKDGIDTFNIGYVEFDGSSDENFINITQNNDASYRAQIQISSYSAPQIISNLGVLSNKLKPYEIINTNLNDMKYGEIACGEYSSWNGSRIIIAFPSSCSNIELCKQWLQSNPIKVWYQLATPTTEQNKIILKSYYPYTNAWHDSEVEASDLTWNILARQYGSGQTTIKKDEAVLTELDLNTQRKANPTTVKVQLQDSEGKVLYLETSSENIYIQSGRFSGKTVQQVLENSIQAISATDEYIEVDVPDSMTQSIDEEFLVDEVDESETETE